MQKMPRRGRFSRVIGAAGSGRPGAAVKRSGRLFCLLALLIVLQPAGVQAIILAPPATYVGGNITTDTTWTLDGSPYIVTADIYVYSQDPDAPAVTLTIEPGVEVRFDSGKGLYIGGPWAEVPFRGALSAEATAASPIVFTSNTRFPAPGAWKGIYFTWAADTDHCVLSGCRVQYGGDVHDGCVVVENGHPLLRGNTICYSRRAGIVVSDGDPLVACNTFLYNPCGLLVTGRNRLPSVHRNNFVGSRYYGVRREGEGTLDAAENWWGNPRGPAAAAQEETGGDDTGDRCYGDVSTLRPLAAPAECAPPVPPDHPPLKPFDPDPADGAADLVLSDDDSRPVQLTWKSGDRDTGDVVRCDLYLGPSAEELHLVAGGLADTRGTVRGLAYDTRYYWRVVARDLRGAAVEGPLWHFVTQPAPPPAVRRLKADGRGDGTTVHLDWRAYDEAAAGDVAFYRIFVQTSPFSDITGLEVAATVPAGTRDAAVGGLLRNTEYWFAAVPVNRKGFFAGRVSAVAARLVDVVPPEAPRELSVQSLNDGLVFSWSPIPDSDGDLAGYRVFFGDDTRDVVLSPDRTSYRRGGLSPATGYAFRVLAVDRDGNRSPALSTTGVTLLPNPSGLAARGRDGYAELSWQPAATPALVSAYRVYVGPEPFDTVAGMTPAVTTTAATAGVGGLVNDRPCHVAVTAVNLSGGETPLVRTVTVVPSADRQGPEITAVRAGDVPLADGFVLRRAVGITLSATDPSGVGRVDFAVDGDLLDSDFGDGKYAFRLDPLDMTDGPHRLSITAHDTLGNTTTLSFAVTTALDLPAAPVVTDPAPGTLTGRAAITVGGMAQTDCRVVIFRNGTPTGAEWAVDEKGAFSAEVTLVEGENRIQAAARNRAGTGPLSDALQVTLDTDIPAAPVQVEAVSRAAGLVRLKWRLPPDAGPVAVNIYRSRASFDTPGEADVVNAHPLTAGFFEDLPPEDGTWHYRLAARDAAGNRSPLSDEVTVVADSTPPRAESIAYFPEGPFDPGTGRVGPGLVGIRLTVSEPLQRTPFLSICPRGGTPVAIALTRESDRVYTGVWGVSRDTPTGAAWAVFSGRDRVGNRGTGIDDGAGLQIDTSGPQVTRLELQPGAPIRNDPAAPAAVGVILGLNESVKAGAAPTVSFSLSGSPGDAVTVGRISQIPAAPGEAQAWRADFVLPADAGQGAPQSLVFGFAAVDDLGNPGGRIAAQNRFQVYQGTLPPLAVPRNLSGVSLPAGRIRLTWQTVAGAAGYRLYRQAPGEDELTAYRMLDAVDGFTDQPAADGLYHYAVASIRGDHGQTSESDRSAGIAVGADSRAPASPVDLALALTARGIRAEWRAAADTDPVTFRLYRSDQAQIFTTGGIVPVVDGISGTTALDSRPSATAHTYAVTAVDAAGNESAPSAGAYLDPGLLPVSTLSVEQVDDRPPRIRWTHPGGDLSGFDLYLGTPPGGIRLNASPLTETEYVDTGYGGDPRTYTLLAVDGSGHAGLARSVTLPPIGIAPEEGPGLRRGVMNRVGFVLSNRGTRDVPSVRLRLGLGGREHLSDAVDLPAGESITVAVPVGGYADLSDIEEMSATVEISPNPGESVHIVRHFTVEVGESRLVLQLLNERFTRGGRGSLRFSLENTGPEAIEVITATQRGGRPSGDITVRLLDEDGNVLATAPFTQALGERITTLAGGDSVARIPAGGTFTSAAVQIAVPVGAPDRVVLALDVDHVYFRHGRAGEVRMDGPATTRALTLVETSYQGEVTEVSPQASNGDEDIVIRGRAVARASGESLAGVPLNLVITLNGFERSATVMTGEDGFFTYLFRPVASEGGTYGVRAVHPDLSDRPEQAQFVVRRLAVSPRRIDLSVPRNYEKTVSLQVAAGSAADAAHLRLVYEAADQPSGALTPGIHVTLPEPLAALPAGQCAPLSFSVWADNTAPETDTLVLRVADDRNPAWGRVTVRTHFSEAGPALFFSPDHVETGVALKDSVDAAVVLENRGLAPLNEVRLELVSQSGNSIPTWAHLNAAAAQGTLAVGERREINLSFSPDQAAAEGRYAFYLRVRAAQIEPADIGIYVAVTQDGQGGVLFKIADLYTGTQDESGRIVQGLAGARVRLQNEAVAAVSAERDSDEFGEVLFEDLPTGRYKYRVSAPRHQPQTGRVWIRPGVTAGRSVFLDYDLVTVTWEVSETTVSDRYDLVLEATYETDVPAPVVTAEPASVTLPEMQAGDVYSGEFTLVNHGLVRADGLTFQAPSADGDFAWELMNGLPDHLDAKQRVSVAYRVICLRTPGQGDTGGGTCRDTRCIRVGYQWICANGHCSRTAVYHCFSYNLRECGGPGGGIVPVHVSGPAGYGGGSGGPDSPPATVISGPKCFPKPVRRKCPTCSRRDTDHDRTQHALGTVDLAMRQYNRDRRDLFIRVPGGEVAAQRRYYDNAWHWEHRRHNLVFETAVDGTLHALRSAGVTYEAAVSGSDVFVHGVFRIAGRDDGYRWSDPRGNWKTFDTQGRLTAYGTRRGTLARLIYEADRLSGIVDRNDRQVLWYDVDDEGRITAATDAAGRRVEYAYDDGRLTGVTDVLGNTTAYDYDAHGRIVRITDAAGQPTVISYDTTGNVSSVTGADGTGWSFEYGYDEATKGTDVTIRSPGGRIKQVWYNRRGETRRVQINGRDVKTIVQDGRNLIVTDETGNITRKAFDEWGNLTRITYPDGSKVSWEYEHLFNHLTEKTDERGMVTRYEYDDAGNLTRKTEAAGTDDERITEFTCDADGNRLSRRRLPDNDTDEALTTYRYDEDGNLAAVTDAEGHTTTMTYDIAGNLVTRTDAAGRQWRYEYDAAGRATTLVDPAGHVTRYAYDAADNRVSATDALDHEKTFSYDPLHHLTQRTDATGGTATFEYNADGRLIRHTDAEGRFKRFEYDTEGRLTQSIDGGGNTVSLEYQRRYDGCSTCSAGGAADKPSRIIFPTFRREYRYDKRGRRTVQKDFLSETEALVSSFEYDPAGNLITRTDPQDHTTRYFYDALNRLTSVIDAAGGETRYRYDNRDNLIELTDAKGRTTRFAYDRLDHLVGETRPMGQEIRYRYDETGALAEKIDAEGRKTLYSYNAAGKLSLIEYFADNGDSGPAGTVRFTYDAAGNMIGWDDGTASAVFCYDAANRKISETVDYGVFRTTVAYEYFRNGLKKSFTAPDGTTYRYRYDEANRLAAVEIPNQGTITFTRYTWNRPTNILFPGGGTQSRTYDPLMRVSAITVKDPARNPLMNYRYTYDQTGNIVTKETGHGTYAYAYDDLNRLVEAQNPTLPDEAYTYDSVGNRLTSADTDGLWQYNANDELEKAGDITYAYHADGSMAARTAAGNTTRFFYNPAARLSRVESPSGTVISQYGYDPFGRRLWKEVDGARTWFVYSDEGLIAEYTANGTPIRSYGYKPNSLWTTDPLFLKTNNHFYFYQNDHLGTPQQLTAPNGAIAWSAIYTSFGHVTLSISSTIDSPIRFSGQYYDIETEDHYNYNRFYSPNIGRYIQADPLGFSGGINLFVYVSNNFINKVDPYGLEVIALPENTEWPDLPNQPIIGYNYCGPGNNGRIPTNMLDQACKEHDECYDRCGISSDSVSISCPGQDPGPSCQDDCDDALCEAAGIHRGWIRLGVRYLFCD